MADLSHLASRAVIKVSGPDARDFLQNIVTQDIAKLEPSRLVYACLLAPQGRFLHDLFIFLDNDAYFVDCEAARQEDLLRRLMIFKLRSKVVIEKAEAFFVYNSAAQLEGGYSFKDPRLEGLGWRSYATTSVTAEPESFYKDKRIHLGVAEGGAEIRPDVDVVADANLEHLHAIAWDKGCFVGQEVTARMNYRGLAKKRMTIVSGSGLVEGASLTQDGHAVGEIRAVNAAGTEGLALVKLAALERPLMMSNTAVSAHLPPWLTLDNT